MYRNFKHVKPVLEDWKGKTKQWGYTEIEMALTTTLTAEDRKVRYWKW